jgi:hypothetical protein
MEKVKAMAEDWSSRKKKTSQISWNEWSYQEKVYFLNEIEVNNIDQLKELDKAFSISNTNNNEVLFSWLMRSVKIKYTASYPRLEEFLTTVGRRKFVAPLYEELVATEQTPLAKEIYAKARPSYHAVTTETIDKLLKNK